MDAERVQSAKLTLAPLVKFKFVRKNFKKSCLTACCFFSALAVQHNNYVASKEWDKHFFVGFFRLSRQKPTFVILRQLMDQVPNIHMFSIFQSEFAGLFFIV